ncbi:MAG: AgmX/PglI C-terminal domain-containing protein [Polyangiaceae bacterium]
MRKLLVVAMACACFVACGGSNNPPPASATTNASDAGDVAPASSSSAPAGSTTSTSDPGAVATNGATNADAGAPAAADPHPFAKDAADAESMIDDAIESRHSDVEKCAADARKRMGDQHGKVSLLVGIDQEGSVIGVKVPKGEKKDEKLLVCVRAALKGAPFPRSHNGVITIKKTYEEALEGHM